ncbi:MAG TPA: DNRLRE domain-containing protein [Gaiellaceae bacterium]|nr:DNRLRE domain-containing protein [Gaiellaceae bacterium]
MCRRLALVVLLATLACLGVAHAAGMSVTSTHLYAQKQTVTHVVCNQTSTSGHDTSVDQGSPSSSSGGTATTLLVDNTGGQNQVALVRFDLSGCAIPATGGADSAVLTLHVIAASKGQAHTISVYPVYSSWSESLTWNGLAGLTIGSTPTDSFTNSTGTKTITVTADVDAAIKSGALWGWELRDTAGNGKATTTFGAAENGTAGDRPSMTLTYEK